MDRFMDRFGYLMDLNGTISATTSFLADRRLVQAFELIVEVFHLTGAGTPKRMLLGTPGLENFQFIGRDK